MVEKREKKLFCSPSTQREQNVFQGSPRGRSRPWTSSAARNPPGFLCQAGSLRSRVIPQLLRFLKTSKRLFGIGPAGRFASRAVFPLRLIRPLSWGRALKQIQIPFAVAHMSIKIARYIHRCSTTPLCKARIIK